MAKTNSPKEETIVYYSKEERNALITKYKRRLRFSLILVLISLLIIFLNRSIDGFNLGRVIYGILFFALLAAVGFYGQYRTLEINDPEKIDK